MGASLMAKLKSRGPPKAGRCNTGKNRSTKPYLPWVILFFEVFDTKEEAIAREQFFKTLKQEKGENILNRPRGATE